MQDLVSLVAIAITEKRYRSVSGGVGAGFLERPLAPPNPDDPNSFGLSPVDNAKRWSNQFTEKGLAKFEDDAAEIRVVGKQLDAGHHLADQAVANFRGTQFHVSGANVLQIGNCGFGDQDRDAWHWSRPGRVALSRPRATIPGQSRDRQGR